jgi:hypothetical protein
MCHDLFFTEADMITQERESISRIEKARHLGVRAADKCAEKGVTPEELAIAGLYTAYQLASAHAGPGIAAIEWMRLGADVLERQLLKGISHEPKG